jgi:hypothetical protein
MDCCEGDNKLSDVIICGEFLDYLRKYSFSRRILLYEVVIFPSNNVGLPVPVAERSKAWVCSCSPAGIAGSNLAEGMDICLL